MIGDPSFVDEYINKRYRNMQQWVDSPDSLLSDFEYLDILKISETAVQTIINALKDGCTIYTDTNMALSGINKMKLNALGCEYKCLVADERVKELAKEKGITRSMAAIEVAMSEEGKKLFVFGNAPTAL